MPIYKCTKCLKDFKQKSHYDKHINNKKYPCKQINENINNLILSETSENTDKRVNINIQEKDEIKCNYCNKIFKRLFCLNRHLDGRCIEKKQNDEIIRLKELMNIFLQNEQIKNETLKKAMSEIELIKKENEHLKSNYSDIKGNTNNGNINNGTISNSSSNINNGIIGNGNTINIVQFGKEDLSKLDIVKMMDIYLKSTGGNILSNILKYINFNPDYPENYNIMISDLAREIVKIYNGQKFVSKKFKNVKDELINILSNHVTNMCDSYMQNSKIKKNTYILEKIKINNISVKLINDECIEDLIRDKPKDNNDEISDELDEQTVKKIEHLESKREGLKEITIEKLKDELYNGKILCN
jgi:hypothetical protein